MLTRIQKIRSPAWQAKCLKGEQIAFETNFIFFFENAYMEYIFTSISQSARRKDNLIVKRIVTSIEYSSWAVKAFQNFKLRAYAFYARKELSLYSYALKYWNQVYH